MKVCKTAHQKEFETKIEACQFAAGYTIETEMGSDYGTIEIDCKPGYIFRTSECSTERIHIDLCDIGNIESGFYAAIDVLEQIIPDPYL